MNKNNITADEAIAQDLINKYRNILRGLEKFEIKYMTMEQVLGETHEDRYRRETDPNVITIGPLPSHVDPSRFVFKSLCLGLLEKERWPKDTLFDNIYDIITSEKPIKLATDLIL